MRTRPFRTIVMQPTMSSRGLGEHEITDCCDDRRCELVTWPKDDDTGVRTRRVPTDVTEPSVERDQQSPVAGGSPQQIVVRCPGHGLVVHRVHVVAERAQHNDRLDRQVLVELDPQRPGDSGPTSSRASSDA